MNKVLLLIALLMTSACGFEVVDTGYRGIKTRFGEVIGEPLPEGLYFYNPVTTSIKEFSVRQEKWADSTIIFTRDTQQVTVEFAVIYYADPGFVTGLYKEYGSEYQLGEKIIKPVVLGSIKDTIGMVIADELVGKREAITRDALKEVKENLAERHVIVTDLQFTNLDFDTQYEQAVEQKVVAIQLAQKAKNETVQIMEQARQKIETAKAEAESMRIKTQALSQNKSLVQYEMVQKWDGALPQYMFGNTIPLMDLKSLGTDK